MVEADPQDAGRTAESRDSASDCRELSAIGWNDAEQSLIGSVLDLLTEGFILFDDRRRFVLCNETYKSFYPLTADLLVFGTPFEDIIRASAERGQFRTPPECAEQFVARRLAQYASQDAVHEQQMFDGRWIRVAERRLKNGWVLGTRTDITEAKARERAREQVEQRLADAVAALQEGFALFDPEDRLVICNETYKSYFPLIREIIEPGVPFEELIRRAAERGQNIESMDDPEAWVQARLNAHAQAGGTFEHEFSDGRYVWVTERKTRDGSTLSTYVEITELKLRELELERARKEAEAASRAKSDFLANMSHEFRTPLNAIIGFTEVMCRQMLGPIENEQYREYLDSVLDSSLHLLRMVNDLLDFEKVEANRLSLNETVVDISEVVASCKNMLAHRAKTNDIALYSESPEPAPLVKVDELAIKKALINVIANAVKFTKAGGAVAIKTEVNASGDVVIRVIDTGIGIQEQDLERILIPFVQVGSGSVEGTGLGLSITKSLVELHSGTLSIASTPGDGTTVAITLPKWRRAEPTRPDNGVSGPTDVRTARRSSHA
jgi:two-component system cell cycle sensor histidine kinase PleC